MLKQIDVCGHFVQVKCCEKPSPSMCRGSCNKLLPCGHKCTTVCSAVCTKECQELVRCAVRPACGHLADIPCYLRNQSECYRFICAVCSHVLLSLLFIFSEDRFVKLLCCLHCHYRVFYPINVFVCYFDLL